MRNYLSIEQVSDMLNLGKTSTYKLFNMRGFPKIQLGRKLIVEENDLYEFLDKYKKSQLLW